MSFERRWHGSYAPGVPPEVNFERVTMPEVLTRTAQRFPDRTALIFLKKRITYRELEGMVNRFAKALMDLGVKAGDGVAMLVPNMPQLVIANYAAFRIGAVPVLIDPLCTEEELARQLRESTATVLVALDLRVPVVMGPKRKTGIRSVIGCHLTDFLSFPGNKLLPFLLKDLYLKIPQQAGMYEFIPLLKKYSDEPVENAAGWENPGAVLRTAGTAGTSRGVTLTHANMSSSAQQLRAWFPDAKDGEEGLVAAFPFFQAAGWTGIQNLSILAGWADALIPRPDALAFTEILKKFKPTFLHGTPALFRELLERDDFRKMDFSPVKAFLVGSAPLPARLSDRLKALKDVPVITFYGLTEFSGLGTAMPCGGKEKPGTVGVPLPGTDLKIVDPEAGTQERAPGEKGEVCLKGPQVMKGYSGKYRESATIMKEGWLYTGDIGSLDTDGFLTITDRKALHQAPVSGTGSSGTRKPGGNAGPL